MPRTFPIILLAPLLLASFALAQVELSVSLPMGPYWRPGKYIPVHIKATVPTGKKYWVGLAGNEVVEPSPDSITGLGAGRTSIQVQDGRVDAVVPWLVMDPRAAKPRLFVEERPEQAFGPELRMIGESERLVGWTTPDMKFARELIKAPRLIPVQLDPSQPIKGHPAAWEMLDAIILDADAGARLQAGQIENLLACGVTVAIKTNSPPLPNWPWKKIGDYSVLNYEPVGPTRAGYYDKAMVPAENWEPGWSWGYRKRLMLLAAGLCVPLLGLALWRPPLAWLWTIAYVAVLCSLLAKWWGSQMLIQQAAGEIIVLQNPISQTDSWTYLTSPHDRVATLRWNQVSRPIYATRHGLDDVWISLNCDLSGQPSEFDVRVPANRRVAFMHRTLSLRIPKTTPETPVTSRMGGLAEKIYLPDGGRILGQLHTAPTSATAYGYVEIQQWNAVVIDRREGATTRPSE